MIADANDKELFFRQDILAVLHQHDELTPGDRGADARWCDSGLFLQFTDRGIGEGFAGFEGSARSRPEILAGQHAGLEHEPEQQEAAGRVENQQS